MKRSFCSSLISIILFSCALLSAQPSSRDFEIHKLADGVYAAIHKPGGRAISNAAFVNLGDETLVFDAFISPYAAQELKRVIGELGFPPVKYVVNSHYHDDHIRGNQVFTGASIYSTQKTRDLIEKTEPEEFADETKELPGTIAESDSLLATIPLKDTIRRMQEEFWNNYYKTILEAHQIYHTILPDKIISGKLTIKGTKQSVELIEIGMGHTVSDVILFIPGSKIIFTGDLLFIRNHPWIADGNLDSLKNDLVKIKAMHPSIVVPGHGPVGNKNDVDVLLRYLDQINAVAIQQLNKGLTPDKVKDISVPDEYKSWLLSDFYGPNIRFQMKQIMEQKNKTAK